MQEPLVVLRRSFRRTVNNRPNRTAEEVEHEVARGIVRRVATGNARLMRGRYVTKKDTAKRLERLQNHRFADQ